MDNGAFALVIVGLLLAVFGIVVGFHLGDELGQQADDKKAFWRYNLWAYLVAVGVSSVVWLTGWVMLMFLTLGALAGCIAGLKMGYGESVGPWAAHDRFFDRKVRRRGRRSARDASASGQDGWAARKASRQDGWAARKAERKASRQDGWAVRRPEGEPEAQEPELMSVADPGNPGDRKSRRS